VHCPQHARDEFVNAKALLDERHQCRDSAFVVGCSSEEGEYELLEGFDLVLKRHEVGDCFVAGVSSVLRQSGSPFIGVVDILETDIFLVLEQAIELGMVTMEPKLGEEERRVGLDEGAVALGPISNCSTARLEPSGLSVSLFQSLVVSTSLMRT
jgi:hypothetical protein